MLRAVENELVGPRPEVPKYVALYPDTDRDIILSVKPGVTDYASILYRNEGQLLADALDPEREYIENVLPKKLDHYIRYAQQNTRLGDVRIIIQTLKAVLSKDHPL